MRWSLRAILIAAAMATTTSARAADPGEWAFYHGDYARAASLFRPEVHAGSSVAETILGYQYEYGLGVPKSYEQAALWYHCAAEQGEPAAQFFLGQLYDRGQGVPEDPVEAAKWLDLAAAHAPRDRREYWGSMRDIIGGKMTLDELAEGRRRAVAWIPSYVCLARSEIETLHLPTKKYSRGEPYGER